MPGCEVLKSSATLRSTSTWSGWSPVPRQQNQRMRTSPGLDCESFAGSGVGTGVALGSPEVAGASEVAADTEAAAALADGATGEALVVGLEQATAISTADARSA